MMANLAEVLLAQTKQRRAVKFCVAAQDAKDNDTVTKAEVVDLGSIKGNIGDQNYDLPANADLMKYRAVTIWCKRFSVNFGTAPLSSSMQSMNVQ